MKVRRDRILILRPDNIGDCVLFSGSLQWIRARWPEAHIDLMTQAHVANLFDECPYIDGVRSVDRYFPWRTLRRRALRGSWMLEKLFRHEGIKRLLPYPHYDTVLYPVSAPTEEYLDLARHIHARDKRGFCGFMLNIERFENEDNRPENVFTSCCENRKGEEWNHEFTRMELFLRHLEVPFGSLWPMFWLSEQDEAFAAREVPESSTLGVFIGAYHHWRRWAEENWIDVLNRQTVARHVVLFGSERDAVSGDRIAAGLEQSGTDCRNLAGRTSLRELAACLARCCSVVSTESAGLHMAVALHVPTVGLTGGHHYGRYYPWGDERINRVASVDMDCFNCNERCKFGDYRCISGISVETVLRELQVAAAASKPTRKERTR